MSRSWFVSLTVALATETTTERSPRPTFATGEAISAGRGRVRRIQRTNLNVHTRTAQHVSRRSRQRNGHTAHSHTRQSGPGVLSAERSRLSQRGGVRAVTAPPSPRAGSRTTHMHNAHRRTSEIT